MRKILTIALVLTLCSGAAMANKIGLYSDAAGTNCWVNPGPFQLVTVYVIQQDNMASRGAKFKINDALGLTRAGETVAPTFLAIGLWYEGIEIATPACVTGDFLLGTLSFFHQLEVMDCARTLEVVPHAQSEIPGFVITADCTEPFVNFYTAIGGRLFGGPDACGGCVEPPLATTESTWGGIKALYR